MSAATAIAAAIEECCDVEVSLPMRPNRLAGRMAYVEPADTWKEHDSSFCGLSVGLDLYLIAGTTDPNQAVEYLDVESSKVMALGRIDIGDDEVFAKSVGRPFQLIQEGISAHYVAVKIELSRFTIEESK